MYKQYDINLLYRFIGLLLFLLTISFINNIYLLTMLFFGIFILNKKNNSFILFLAFLTLFFLIFKYMNNSVLVVNVMLILDYMFIFFLNIKKEEMLLVKNMILNKKLTYQELGNSYRKEISENNEKAFNDIIKDNNLVENDDLLEIKERLVGKDKDDVFDKLVVNYTRFYKNQNDNNKCLGINRETILYLGIHVVILIVVMVI